MYISSIGRSQQHSFYRRQFIKWQDIINMAPSMHLFTIHMGVAYYAIIF